MVRAIADAVPAMSASYLEGDDGKPRIVRHERVSLGLAVDVEKPRGGRSLLVPVVRDADLLDFRGFWVAYDELIRKVHGNKLTPDDFAGATLTLTNPGTIGTVQSVPRLMAGQGLIAGVGALEFPAQYAGADPATLAELGISKVLTISSTYDHRIIQGAESGLFLQRVHQLLVGEHGFYEDVFHSLGVPYESVAWHRDVNPVDHEATQLDKQLKVSSLINMYRVRGHLIADLDPLAAKEPHMHPELDPATYGLTIWDLDRSFLTGVAGERSMALGDALHVLRDAYCRTIGIEYMHISQPEEKQWVQERVEGVPFDLTADDQRHILDRLNAAEAFEMFLGKRYIGQKRFGLEGAESAIPILDQLLTSAADAGHEGVVLGMAHRGRLNVLANIVGKSYDQIFREFEGHIDPNSTQGSGDVKYHLGQTGKFTTRDGATIPVELAANPSHLEAVDPIVEGVVRARQDLINDPDAFSVLPILVHGDAAFAGQGVVAETLNLSTIKGYRVGGTVHLIINNQLGFTTPPDSARSSEYCTDIAKMVQAPIFHVNGDDPEACVQVAKLAFEYRETFRKDVVVDMVCYRRHGHNEGDDPSYTQPLMYKRIDARRSVRKRYTETLVTRGDLSLDDAEKALDDFHDKLQSALDETRSSAPSSEVVAKAPPPPVGVLPAVPTGVDRATLERIFQVMSHPPDDFTMHPKLARQFATRDKMFESGEVDWALAEALAFGSLLLEGSPLRMAGQDTRRGTFSQRHSVLVDYETGGEWAPLAHLSPDQGKYWIYDSLLSEYAALGFEYGYSVANRDALVVWEAQFGDFVNGASIIIDQYLVAAEDKWGQTSGLVLLLPHGYEGQGPEHSSARTRTVPHPVRRGQPAGRERLDLRAVLPPAPASAPPRRAQAAGGVHPEVAAPGQVRPLAARRARVGLVPRGARRRTLRATRVRSGSSGSCCAAGRSPTRSSRRATNATSTWRWCASSSSTRGPKRRSSRRSSPSRTPPRSCGSRRSRRTWAPGRSCTPACTSSCAPTTRSGTCHAPSRGVPPREVTPSTCRSRPSSSTRRSVELAPGCDRVSIPGSRAASCLTGCRHGAQARRRRRIEHRHRRALAAEPRAARRSGGRVRRRVPARLVHRGGRRDVRSPDQRRRRRPPSKRPSSRGSSSHRPPARSAAATPSCSRSRTAPTRWSSPTTRSRSSTDSTTGCSRKVD